MKKENKNKNKKELSNSEFYLKTLVKEGALNKELYNLLFELWNNPFTNKKYNK